MVRFPLLFITLVFFLLIQLDAKAASSDWLLAPRPKFPPNALQKWSEGDVRLKLSFAQDGTVTRASIIKSSGDAVLDQTARGAVLKWKLKPSALRPSDLTKGRVEEIDFKQEAPVAAVYPDRAAAFTTETGAFRQSAPEQWMFAPFPSYPMSEGRLHHSGKVILYGRIAADGRVVDVRVLQTSGYPELDRCAVAALRLWRAHKTFAGTQFQQPIKFDLQRR